MAESFHAGRGYEEKKQYTIELEDALSSGSVESQWTEEGPRNDDDDDDVRDHNVSHDDKADLERGPGVYVEVASGRRSTQVGHLQPFDFLIP